MKRLCTLLILLVAFIDQISKEYLRPILENGNIIKIINNIQLVHAWNPGISFGMFKSLQYNQIIFSISSAIIIVILLLYLIKETRHSKLSPIAISLIIGGALGNLIDRLHYSAVYDFIDFYINNWHWPTFNLADSFIVLGSLLLILKCYIDDKISIKKN